MLCPFHKTPLTEGLSKNEVPYMYCRDFDAVCPFWVMGANRVQTLTNAVEEQLHLDIRREPWNYFHGERTPISLTMNPESPNKGRFFLTCRQEQSCKLFQWLDSEWSNSIILFLMGRAHQEQDGGSRHRSLRENIETRRKKTVAFTDQRR